MQPSRMIAAATALILLLPSACGRGGFGDVTVNIGIGTETPGFSVGHPPAGFDVAFKDFVVQDMEKQADDVGSPFNVGLVERLTAPEREQFLLEKKITLVIASFSITEARNQKGIDFAGPYMKTDQAFLVRDRGVQTIDEKDDLSGKSLCRVRGTTGEKVPMPPELRQTTIKGSTAECVELLNDGSIDVVFTDALILYGFKIRNPGLRVTMVGAYGSTQYYGIGILGGRLEECKMLNGAIKRYLNTRWRNDFEAYFGNVRADYPNFESMFKPTGGDWRLSCQLANEP